MKWDAIGLACLILPAVNAIYADDAYHIDYHEALLGIPQADTTFFHKPQSSSNASLLYTLSDKAVLGAVNPRDGSLVWRQALAGQPLENAGSSFLIAREVDGTVVTGYNDTIATWDAQDGRLVWDYKVQGELQVRGLQTVPVVRSGTNSAAQDVVCLTCSTRDGSAYTVERIAGDGREAKWQYTDTTSSSDSSAFIATSLQHVYYISKSSGLLSGSKAKVIVLDISTGKEVNTYSINTDSEFLGSESHRVVASGTATPFLASSERPFKTIKVNILGSSKLTTLTLEDKGEEIEKLSVHASGSSSAASHFLVHVQTKTTHWAEVFHINAKKAEVVKAYSVPATREVSAFTASSAGSTVYFTRVTDSEVMVYSSESHGQLGRWRRNEIFGTDKLTRGPWHATAEIASRSGSSLAVRVAITSYGGSWYLIRNGDAQWIRPEMLAYASLATWSDTIEQDSLIQEIQNEVSANPMAAYLHRITRHAQEMVSLPSYLFSLPQRILGPVVEQGPTTRQNLIGSKYVIIATSQSQVLALDATHSGAIRWQTDLRHVSTDFTTVKSLASEAGRVTMYLSDGSIVVLNATDGSIVDKKAGSIPITRLIQLPGNPASTILKIGEDGTPQTASDLAPSVPLEGNGIVTINDQGEAVGWTIGQSVEKTWTLQPPEGAKIVSTIGRPSHDPVASVGKVLGDRSVLYKYLSPNLALLTALSSTTLTIYLIEAVTGAILHTSTYPGVLTEEPIPTLLSENWFAYSFTRSDPATNGVATQLIISELYESAVPNDRGALAAKVNYSSYSPDAGAKPYVMSQAYTIAEPISILSVSQTAQGITSRQVLAVLKNSNAILAIPRHVLDARRPIGRTPTSVEAEEGLFQYSPILDLDPKSFLTHSREVIGIDELISAPTLLESTSILFGFGHDIFGMQMAPSMTFDVLGKDFKKIQLMLTVVALYIGVVFLRPIVRKKVVERRWL